ncbi:MAG: aminotransferase class V-fold PLP-dependent enzyme [Opitutaceae bacterium]|nr:aminotransferase class V-fold PLP-dependent enzyme [Opitutaceae bacterium]
MNKREFLKSITFSGLALSATGRSLAARPGSAAPPETPPAAPGDIWAELRAAYTLDPSRINLENGYYCVMPHATLEASFAHARDLNLAGSHYLRTRQADDKAAVRRALAESAGCAPEELIVTRNTTESLDTVISGLDWRAGDEAVMAAQDYGSMLDMFRQQARRHGIVNRVVSLPLDPQSDDEIVSLYAEAITPRTRLVLVSHLVNLTGQILPVRRICDAAHARGVPVLVDGAHSFAHLDFRIPDLGCDYFGASLHKWLGAPLGTGLLYVRRDRIAGLWPLFGDTGYPDDDIRKLNHIGTNPVHAELTILDALRLHAHLGPARKEARLRFLQEYWTSRVRGRPGLTLNTPAQSARACAIANVRVDRLPPGELARILLERHRLWTVAIDAPDAGVRGVRVTPNLFTTTAELDILVDALRILA